MAIVLCQGAAQDYANGYRSLRVLADALAREGYPVLRFDYPGTGDSRDEYGEHLWRAWRQSVKDAGNWLRRTVGAECLILMGVRIGAGLAAVEAARRDDIAGLVLFEPFFHARSFVLQLVTESRLRKRMPANGNTPDDAGGLQVGELNFSTPDVVEMRNTDFTRLAFGKAMPTAVFSRIDRERISDRLEPWCRQGIKLTAYPFEDFEALLRPNQHSGEAEIDPAALLDWMNREIPHGMGQARISSLPRSLKSEHWEEKIVRFGSHSHLVGMLCAPKAGSALAVIICNSGGNPRHGFARSGVTLARGLADAGITSFRFDFSGLGDSIHLENAIDTQSDVFRQERTGDLSAAVDALKALGIRRFAIHGLCSGAFHAVQAAYVDSRIEALITINLPWFSLRHEAPGAGSSAQKSIVEFKKRKMRALFMFGSGDAGLNQFERNFGQAGHDLAEEPGMHVLVSEDIDHELTEPWMQAIAIRETIRFLEDRMSERADNLARHEVLSI